MRACVEGRGHARVVAETGGRALQMEPARFTRLRAHALQATNRLLPLGLLLQALDPTSDRAVLTPLELTAAYRDAVLLAARHGDTDALTRLADKEYAWCVCECGSVCVCG
jgi:hypothetical protein